MKDVLKENLVELYGEYLEAYKIRDKEIYGLGGSWSAKPDLPGFIEFLRLGYID